MTNIGHEQAWYGALSTFALQLVSILTLGCIIVAFALFWPIPYLGIDIDRATGTITYISPEAGHDELHLGDRVVRMYGLPWVQVVNHWNLAAAIGDQNNPIAIEVERDGSSITASLLQQPPTLSLQLSKLINLTISLLCWSAGYFLGVVRRQDMGGSVIVSVLWLLIAAVFSLYLFGRYLSLPILAIVQWSACTFLVPLCMYCHVIFPPRTVPEATKRVWGRGIIVISTALNATLITWVVVVSPTVLDLTTALGLALIAVVCLVSLVSGGLLFQAYQLTSLAHIRRQIRLILIACFVVAVVWGFVSFALEFTQLDTLVLEYVADLVIGLVPVAYLVSGVMPDLYRLDRITIRSVAFLLSGLLITLIFVSISALLAPVSSTSIILIALLAALLYRPLYYFFLRLLPVQWSLQRNYGYLRQSVSALTATLDAPTIAAILQEGIDRAFQSPACAIYLADNKQDTEVALVRCTGFSDLPIALPIDELETVFDGERHMSNARELHNGLKQRSLQGPVTKTLIHNRNIVLWAPLVHTQGHILGVAMLGHSGNLDPYRPRDIRELQQIFDAASLALTNTWTYRERCIAEETVRHMFVALQAAQETTAAAIAREIHDEVINVSMRLNIQALQRLLHTIDEPHVRDELELLVESEQAVVTSLRMVCEQLYPTGVDDPLGLPHVIRQHLDKVQLGWSGSCSLRVVGEQVELPITIQREVFRIVREAVTNAAKHASATTIAVSLIYEGDDILKVEVEDNGQKDQLPSIKSGHWGIRGMYESAATMQGQLEVHRAKSGGTLIVLVVPILVVASPTVTVQV